MSEITFPDAVRGVINCSSKPMDGVKVKIGPLTDTPEGAVLKISWQGFSDSEGQTPIPGANTSLNHFVTPGDVANGLEKTIGDWIPHIKPIKNGSARVTYTINGGGGNTASVLVRLLNASNQSCDEV
ncbi:hypothetical protein [Pseudomonas sp. Irchel 3E19]|uniref:hypothetical protein n=1 Tax=Pseudomonas sp. Irchel 3E19 TaxID=2008981 RepID=UPI000BA3C0ED|nr:hypothetical protein [Pseudomonas sp. Irchel 3E19]